LKFFFETDNMYRIIIILLVLWPFCSFSQLNQTDANGLRQGQWKKQQPNGKPLYEGQFKDDKPVGEWKRYHEGGQIKAIINYDTDSDSAFAQLFDEWGKKVAEGNYIDEKKTGTWRYYSDDRLISDEQFANGVKNGVSHMYYETGEKLEEADWINGKEDGTHRVFFKNGKPFMEYKMKDGLRNGLCITYFQNGGTELEANYKNGLRDGTWSFYNENGGLWYILKYYDGDILNPNVRDSIENLKLQNFEKNKDNVVDPEKYLEDPAEFMMKKNINR
jgi:antitoxin component YwqK of YwqJK toxin-antitoxin module